VLDRDVREITTSLLMLDDACSTRTLRSKGWGGRLTPPSPAVSRRLRRRRL